MAANIPLPALQIQPPQQQGQQDLLSNYARALQIRNMFQMAPLQQQQAQQNLQAGQLSIQEQQQQQKDQQGIANWYKSFDPSDPSATDPVAVGRALATQGVSGGGIMKVQQGILQQRQTLATLTKDQLANQQTVSDNLANGINGIIGETDPNKRASALIPLVQTAAQNKLIQPQMAQQVISNPTAVTDDQLKQFQHGLTVSAAFTQAAARSQAAKNEADRLAAQQNPQSPLYAPTPAAVAMGTAPGAAQIQTNEVQQAGAKAGAEAKARQPYELSLRRAEQAIQDGDPQAAGQLLMNGDVAPSQILTARKPEFAQKAFQAAHDLSGGTWNAQSAEANFKVAGSPANVAFFGSAKSLTDPGGTLDQLAAAAKDLPQSGIPALNTAADWVKTSTGNGPLAKYASLALGASDDYSKVMGGGQGSDSSRSQALNLFKPNASPDQRAGSIEGVRGAVNSQKTSRIGKNPVLQRMYGDTDATQQPAQTNSNDPFAQFGGKAH